VKKVFEMSEQGNKAVEIRRAQLKEQCAFELEQLAALMRQTDAYIKTIDRKLREIEVQQQKIMSILKHEIDITYAK
jgi:hypothetical protein